MAIEDRTKMSHLYHTMLRNNRISWCVGLVGAFEMVTKVAYFKKLALGWKGVNVFLFGYLFKSLLMSWSSSMYGPVMGAYLRKYQTASVKTELFNIKDAKKEYFYIDTSEYMNYAVKDLGDEYHCHHGPQPVSTDKRFDSIYFRRENPWTVPG
jgi:hypothetical protein